MKTSVKLSKKLSAEMCCGRKNCPGVWQLESGDIAVIGKLVPRSQLKGKPLGASAGRDERMVIIPRDVLKSARDGIFSL